MLIGISSCATNKESVSQPVESDAKLAIVENPSGSSEIPFEAGETVKIYTKSKISISSWDVGTVEMVITDVNTTRIMGKVKYVCCDYEYGKEDVVGEIVEVDIDNIAKIWLYEEQVQAVGNRTTDEKVGEFVAQLAFIPVEMALRVVGLVVFIRLLMFIL
jgi:hypothetical protein